MCITNERVVQIEFFSTSPVLGCVLENLLVYNSVFNVFCNDNKTKKKRRRSSSKLGFHTQISLNAEVVIEKNVLFSMSSKTHFVILKTVELRLCITEIIIFWIEFISQHQKMFHLSSFWTPCPLLKLPSWTISMYTHRQLSIWYKHFLYILHGVDYTSNQHHIY